MKNMKGRNSSKLHQFSTSGNRRYPSASLLTLLRAGAVLPLILFGVIAFTEATNLFGLNGSASATTSTITLSVTSGLSVDVIPSDNGTFASSTATNNVSIKTDSASGYELGIKASTSGSNNNALINTTDSSKTIPSITTSISEADYSSSSSYNNTWGLKPSKLNSQANSNYIPGPSSNTNLTVIDKTTTANPTTFNNYTITLGTRIDNTQAPGSYANTFVITAVANPTPYTITYNKNTTDTVTNMPANTSSQTYDEEVNISDQVPARDGFNFKGWCTVQVADGGTCSGTTYNPDGGGTDLTWTLDQTQASNSLSLYAMWATASHCKPTGTTITTIGCMQDITSSNKSSVLGSMTQGTQYQLYDSRDDQQYWVARQADDNIWMTQNLDLDIGGTGVAALTSDNTDLNTSGSGIYVDGYDNSTGVIIWTPDNTAKTSNATISGTTVTGWTNDNYEPYSAEGGDNYYYTTGTTSDETAQTLAQCTASHTEGECKHYHVGNYYNWTAAIASNASSGISTQYAIAANSICPKGWKLPQGRSSTAGDATTRQFGNLWYTSGIITSVSDSSYATNGFNNIRTSPLFFVRGGYVLGSSLGSSGSYGFYWSSSVNSASYAYFASFDSSTIISALSYSRNYGQSIRCMVR